MEEQTDEDYINVGKEGVRARWSSLAAPLLPTLLLSRRVSQTLFSTPWREAKNPVLKIRAAAFHISKVFDEDCHSQTHWLQFCAAAASECSHFSPAEVVCWTYTFAVLLASHAGATAFSAALGFGALAQPPYYVGAARTCVGFVYEALAILEKGPTKAARALVRAKIRDFVLSAAAAVLLPGNVLSAHVTACLIFGICEKITQCLILLAGPAREALLGTKAAALHCAAFAAGWALAVHDAQQPSTPWLLLPVPRSNQKDEEAAMVSCASSIGCDENECEAQEETRDERVAHGAER